MPDSQSSSSSSGGSGTCSEYGPSHSHHLPSQSHHSPNSSISSPPLERSYKASVQQPKQRRDSLLFSSDNLRASTPIESPTRSFEDLVKKPSSRAEELVSTLFKLYEGVYPENPDISVTESDLERAEFILGRELPGVIDYINNKIRVEYSPTLELLSIRMPKQVHNEPIHLLVDRLQEYIKARQRSGPDPIKKEAGKLSVRHDRGWPHLPTKKEFLRTRKNRRRPPLVTKQAPTATSVPEIPSDTEQSPRPSRTKDKIIGKDSSSAENDLRIYEGLPLHEEQAGSTTSRKEKRINREEYYPDACVISTDPKGRGALTVIVEVSNTQNMAQLETKLLEHAELINFNSVIVVDIDCSGYHLDGKAFQKHASYLHVFHLEYDCDGDNEEPYLTTGEPESIMLVNEQGALCNEGRTEDILPFFSFVPAATMSQKEKNHDDPLAIWDDMSFFKINTFDLAKSLRIGVALDEDTETLLKEQKEQSRKRKGAPERAKDSVMYSERRGRSFKRLKGGVGQSKDETSSQ